MADSRQQIIGEINGEIQGAVDAFNDAIPQMEKSLVRKINLIIKDLDLNPNGTIKSTIANMKKMRTIEREMAVAFESAQYLGNVEKYTNAYDKTRAIEGKYFDKVLTDYSEPAIMNEIQSQAVSTVTKELNLEWNGTICGHPLGISCKVWTVVWVHWIGTQQPSPMMH